MTMQNRMEVSADGSRIVLHLPYHQTDGRGGSLIKSYSVAFCFRPYSVIADEAAAEKGGA